MRTRYLRIAVAFCITAGIVFTAFRCPASMTPEEETNVRVYERASPAVVNITTTVFVRDFFAVYPQEGSGSGSIIDAEGHIVTNYHVVEGAGEISVTLTDGTRYEARLVGADEERDIAVLKIVAAGKRRLPFLPLGSSADLRVGQKVYAIGNPFGLHSTLTAGIISALGRPIRTDRNSLIEGVIQTDTPINPGNSGGPLLDTSGRMIGVNTAIFTPSGGSVGIGFAIPVDTIRPLVDDLVKYGRVRKAWLGVVTVPLWPELAAWLKLPVTEGLLVSEVIAGSPADRSGILGGRKKVRLGRSEIYLGGDVILSLDKTAVTSLETLRSALRRFTPGETVDVRILRQGKERDVRLKLGEAPIRRR